MSQGVTKISDSTPVGNGKAKGKNMIFDKNGMMSEESDITMPPEGRIEDISLE